MVDPHLFEQLHGITQKVNSSSANDEKDSYDLAFDKAIKEHVDSLMAEDEATGNKLLSPEARRAKLEQELRASADLTEFGNLMAAAFNILRSEGLRYLEREQTESLLESLDQLSRQLDSLDPSNLTDEVLQGALTVPDDSRQSILQIGIAKYNEGLIDDSLAIFTFLSTVDGAEPDYWYRLGLVAQKCEKYDLAIRAFAATSELAPEFIGARIFAAQCHHLNGHRDNALAELQEAKNIAKNSDVGEEWRKQIVDVESLLAETDSNKEE